VSDAHLLETEQERYVEYLRDRLYKAETVRSYRHSINLLLKKARERGWETPPQVLPPHWSTVMALASEKEVQAIVRFAARIKKSPSTFDEDDLKAWVQERIKAGRKLTACRSNVSLFRRLMSRPELAHLHPLVTAAPKRYGTPLRNMLPSLRNEVEGLLSFLTDEFEFERRGPVLRPATVQNRLGFLERLVGFVENIQRAPRVETLSDIITKTTVAEYTKWAMKVRKVNGENLFTGLAGLHADLKKHPGYAGVDLSWLPAILEKLPRVQQSDIDRRKEGKYIPFDVANAIPGRIREARARARNQTDVELALSLRDELIMLWLVILPWRQRNLRECRLEGGPHKNLYHAPISKNSSASQPAWLLEQEKKHPGKPVWQIYFSKDETKSKNEAAGFLPLELAALLEEYLNHRSALIRVGKPDPGTLFLSDTGTRLTQKRVEALVESLTSVYAGTATNPHLFRDIVAYEWLREHPEDFLTLSKLLWHASVEYTLKVYGSRFNESTGIARMDDWRAKLRRVA
jgi:integrase